MTRKQAKQLQLANFLKLYGGIQKTQKDIFAPDLKITKKQAEELLAAYQKLVPALAALETNKGRPKIPCSVLVPEEGSYQPTEHEKQYVLHDWHHDKRAANAMFASGETLKGFFLAQLYLIRANYELIGDMKGYDKCVDVIKRSGPYEAHSFELRLSVGVCGDPPFLPTLHIELFGTKYLSCERLAAFGVGIPKALRSKFRPIK